MSSPLNPGTATEHSFTPVQTLSEQEKKLQRLYGNRLPTAQGLLGQKLKERKYFDSGDYALSKAGKTSAAVGSQHPQPENIPHSTPSTATHHGSPPVKESSLIHEADVTPEVHPTSAQPNV
ncbi:camp-regulated phospho protein/endosulfine conserved region-domain-containing protein [Lobosporangium transversale]|uniref:mRNA stability protein n=1 Tax=Lobosporangium transversale TaxID=64571 RepID=A0A1Y2GI03_9FUNG|nr:camp-regulated phospho protein/endosulfine conserved region-domain-containing protein [Lobosporangium transversale]ORZ10307.1 camp-regulated phospho protein/endosulfine conserved region-domain-containing protein [Lobosporangium transversale]|eukprot:XP_021879214.1 camp-regulated phospho protein/endosulfine conserved region-domain-containing protein [Lobosporangium transversale]